ncbi:MAG: hypothetical protein IJ150_10275 [Bacteroidales bacterium]|nr:hypothetical protein [Bacteroidales bacterium]
MRFISLLFVCLLSLNFLVACSKSKTDRLAELEYKGKTLARELELCVLESKNYSGEGCEKKREEFEKVQAEFDELSKKL